MNQLNHQYDAAIIGAGIAGNTMAKMLADYGWNVLLIERKAFPRHKVCGEFLSPESVGVLKSIGVYELIEKKKPAIMRESRIVFNNGQSLEIPLPGSAIGISRYALDRLMLNAAESSGVHVQLTTSVTSIQKNKYGYSLSAKTGAEVAQYQVRTVIAAWGINGQPSLVNISNEGSKLIKPKRNLQHAYVGIKSHFTGIDGGSKVELYFFQGGYIGISPIEDGKVNVAALFRQNDFEVKPKSIQGWIDEACRRSSALEQRLAHATPIIDSQCAIAPVMLNRSLTPWNGIPHIGDSALVIPPLCGDGMSMALRSAQLCAPFANLYLSGRLSYEQWQNQYTYDIHHEFKSPQRWGLLLQSILMSAKIPKILPLAAKLTPQLAHRLVKATRLKSTP